MFSGFSKVTNPGLQNLTTSKKERVKSRGFTLKQSLMVSSSRQIGVRGHKVFKNNDGENMRNQAMQSPFMNMQAMRHDTGMNENSARS